MAASSPAATSSRSPVSGAGATPLRALGIGEPHSARGTESASSVLGLDEPGKDPGLHGRIALLRDIDHLAILQDLDRRALVVDDDDARKAFAGVDVQLFHDGHVR